MRKDCDVPEEIHPGVFVEEAPSGVHPIDGVPTSTAGFVGVVGPGPAERPVDVTSVVEFDRAFGDDEPSPLRRAVRSFFASGGGRVFVQGVGDGDYRAALRSLEGVPQVSIVAAPGLDAAEALIEHAERMRYRFAIIDAPAGATEQEVLSYRDRLDSSYAALYHPYDGEVPPSGHVAAVYARTPPARPPADEGAHEAQLVERGVNVLHVHDDGAIRISGSRTLSSDPDWKYVNVRRYLAYLEHSIDRGTQWTVFEPNGEPLWATVRRTIGDFLYGEFRGGHLVGDRPEDAFFVKCDRSTMTQNDLDDGRLVCLVGVAQLRPAEFVIVRIGRWTADHAG
jgi:Bacteriophage tail sheath protein